MQQWPVGLWSGAALCLRSGMLSLQQYIYAPPALISGSFFEDFPTGVFFGFKKTLLN